MATFLEALPTSMERHTGLIFIVIIYGGFSLYAVVTSLYSVTYSLYSVPSPLYVVHVVLLYIRITMKNLIGPEHSINSQ